MHKTINEEWKQYTFEETTEYTKEEIMAKIQDITEFLKKKKVRSSEEMLMNPRKYQNQFHLTQADMDMFKLRLSANLYFLKNGSDWKTFMSQIDSLYHWYDFDKDELFEFIKYITDEHLTVAQGLKRRYNAMSIEELGLYMDVLWKSMPKFIIMGGSFHIKNLFSTALNGFLNK